MCSTDVLSNWNPARSSSGIQTKKNITFIKNEKVWKPLLTRGGPSSTWCSARGHAHCLLPCASALESNWTVYTTIPQSSQQTEMNLIMCLATVVFRLTLQADLHLDMPDMSGMSESDKAIYWPSGSGDTTTYEDDLWWETHLVNLVASNNKCHCLVHCIKVIKLT